MSLKICGHEVRWQKPIKIYTLVKTLCLLTAINMVGVTTVSAADFSGTSKYSPVLTQASSGDAASRQPLPLSNVKKPALQVASARTQRSAGPSSMSPAMMLALALGYRNVQGPVVRSPAHKVVASRPVKPTDQEAMLIEGDRESISSYTSIIPSAGGDVLR